MTRLRPPPFQALQVGVDSDSGAVGIRFIDPGFDRVVPDGLRVQARWLNSLAPVQLAQPTDTGVYVWKPLVRAARSPTGPLLVEAYDAGLRYQPVLLQCVLPSTPGNVLLKGPRPTGEMADSVWLLSAPTRAPHPGAAALTGWLWDEPGNQPAAFALVEADVGGRRHFGVADGRGMLSMLIPYGPVKMAAPSGGTNWSWPVRVQVYYGRLSPSPGGAIPEQQALFSQPAVGICSQPGAQPVPFHSLTLQFGQSAVLRTHESRLLIAPFR